MELEDGADKYACRIQKFPDMGFLFCKKAIIGSDKCEDVLRMEIEGLKILGNAGIKTVEFSEHLIYLISYAQIPNQRKDRVVGFLKNGWTRTKGDFFMFVSTLMIIHWTRK